VLSGQTHRKLSLNPLLLHIWMHPVTAHNFKCSLLLLSKREFLSIQSSCDVVGGGDRGCYIGNRIVVLQSDSTRSMSRWKSTLCFYRAFLWVNSEGRL
jgi:hypothetical protein